METEILGRQMRLCYIVVNESFPTSIMFVCDLDKDFLAIIGSTLQVKNPVGV